MPIPKAASTDPKHQALEEAADRNASTRLAKRLVEQRDAIADSRRAEPDYATAAKERRQAELLTQKDLLDRRREADITTDEASKTQANKIKTLT